MNNKRGQITIFVIIAVIIVAGILLFFLFRGKIIPEEPSSPLRNPESYIDSCLEPKLEEAVNIISAHGGYINASLYKLFEGEKIAYLCYTQNYYVSCINQEPMLIRHLKDEIKNYIEDDVENCFQQLKSDIVKKGGDISIGAMNFEIEPRPGKIIANIKRDISITKSGETSRYKEFKAILKNPLYDLAIVAQEIASQEARFCNFEHLGFMLLYPQFNIDKFRTGDSTTIYTIQDRKSTKQFRFAVRSCVIPPGF